MPEELRIVIVDQGGGGGAARPGAQPGPAPAVPGPPAAPQPPPVPPPVHGQQPGQRGSVRFGAPQAQQLGVALASGNIRGALSSIAGTLSAAGGALAGAVAGVTIGATAVAAALGGAALAARQFARKISEQVQELAGFSVQIAGAQAQTEIERLQDRFRRARRIGPELVSAERLRSRFESQIYDIGTEIFKVLLRIVERLDPFFEAVLSVLEKVAVKIGEVGPIVGGVFTFFSKRWAKLFGYWEEERDRRLQEEEGGLFFREFQKMFPKDFQFFGNQPPIPGGPPISIPGVGELGV